MKITLDDGKVVDVTKALSDKKAFMANNPELKYCGELMRKVLAKIASHEFNLFAIATTCEFIPEGLASEYHLLENMRIFLNEFRVA